MEYVAALAPTVGVVFLFWLAFRAIMGADRNERAAVARMERDQDRRDAGTRQRQGSTGSADATTDDAPR